MKKLYRLKSFLAQYRGLRCPQRLKKSYKRLDEVSNKISGKGLPIMHPENWERTFRKAILAQPAVIDVIEAFYNCAPKLVKPVEFVSDLPILITMVRNDVYRLEKFLEHYRRIGVRQFAIINNNSSDGTGAYLMRQEDVTVFMAEMPYSTDRREGWINRILAYYGENRWYIIVDLDELLVYTGIEHHGIEVFIEKLQRQKMFRARAMMVDMYSEFIWKEEEDSYASMVYFDTDTYNHGYVTEYEAVTGGFRQRVFGSYTLLTKYPIVYFRKGEMQCNSHFLFPYCRGIGINCYLGLLHYKFLSNDYAKYQEIVKNENFASGSIKYKEYLNKGNENKRVLYARTKKYDSSYDLLNIDEIQEVYWT